jgi:hypothetical protein
MEIRDSYQFHDALGRNLTQAGPHETVISTWASPAAAPG